MTHNKTALAFMAHPDDAEFSCGGTLILLHKLGYNIHIASVTPGDCGTMIHTPHDIASIRTNEARKAASLINATYHCLDERDGFITYTQPAIHKAIDLFRIIAPSLVFTHPLKDYMMDHEMTASLARAASFLYGAPNASPFPRLPQSAVPHLYYVDPSGAIDPLGHPVTPTTLVNITSVADTKEQMLACHASQREWLRAHHGMDEYIQSMKRQDAARGQLINVPFAEAFVQHRGLPYPQSDLLASLFPPNP